MFTESDVLTNWAEWAVWWVGYAPLTPLYFQNNSKFYWCRVRDQLVGISQVWALWTRMVAKPEWTGGKNLWRPSCGYLAYLTHFSSPLLLLENLNEKLMNPLFFHMPQVITKSLKLWRVCKRETKVNNTNLAPNLQL